MLSSIHTAVKSLLETDQTAHAGSWPADCVVRVDPRIYFWDDTNTPEVRIFHDPNSVQLEDLGQGRSRQCAVQVMVGLSQRIESNSELEEFLDWVEYLFGLLNSQTTIGSSLAISPPGEWAYTYDQDSISTGADGEPTGKGIALFLVTLSGVI